MREKDHINELINRYLTDRYTLSDCQEIRTLIAKGIDMDKWEKVIEKMGMPHAGIENNELQQATFNKIRAEINRSEVVRPSYRRWWVGAAAVLILLSAGLYGVFSVSTKSTIAPSLTQTTADKSPTYMVMEDQSQVWINSRSTLKYPTSFNQNIREVALSGQAYFNVTRNEKKEFVVHADELDVKVLGTTFDIKSYPNENEVEITLLSGKVQVMKAGELIHTLLPNQQLTYNKLTKRTTVKEIQPTMYDSWREGELVFTEQPIYKIANGIQRHFGVKIMIPDNNLQQEKVTLKVKDGSLSDVLNILSFTANLSYTAGADKATFTFYRKKTKTNTHDE